ncbi:MAG: ABC transporter ATP-binding protein [Desulfosarcina sp.]|nr:ABC transporter ATP-binding protein [Desulfobacterales bacterium]
MEVKKLKDYIVFTENLNKNYQMNAAVKDVNLKINHGEIFGIIGADGAGKTSTIQMLCGLVDPSSGLIFIDGHNVEKEPDLIRSKIGYMSQDFTLYLDMSVEENIDFIGKLKGMPNEELEQRKERLLSFSRMEPFRDRRAGALSGGMKKKLGLSCALIHKPGVLILDEPTTAVDPISRGDLWRILYEFIVQGITVIISTPYMDEAERCNRVALMQDGEILACDTPENLKKMVTRNIFSCKSRKLNATCRFINEETEFSAQIYGDQMRIFTAEDSEDLSLVETLLAENDAFDIYDVKKVDPNMDDVYMGLLAQNINKNKKLNWIPFNLSKIDKKAIEISNVTKMFKDFRAVDDVSFSIDTGTIFGLLGPNGAGKTTLIKIMCGLLPPTTGKAIVAGYDIATQAELVKKRIGYMSQLFSLYPDLTVKQNIDLYASIYGLKKKDKKIRKDWVIDLAGLRGMEKYLTSDLVGGWKQKLALGCSVLHQPSVLFLDEPTSGVDPVARQEFWDVIYRFSEEGITIVVTTHFMDEADRCNILGLMNAGSLIAMNHPEALKKGLPVAFYELSSTSTLESFDKLLSLDYFSQVSLYGEKIHISSEMDEESVKSRIMGDKSLRISSITKIDPLLEDVFIYHVLESERS